MKPAVKISLAGSALALASLTVVPSANANTAFALAAGGVPCSSCHQPGKETEAPNPSSFNQNGAQVYYYFSTPLDPCHMNIDCAVKKVFSGMQQQPAPQPSYQPQPNYSQQQQPNYQAQPNYPPQQQPNYQPQPSYPQQQQPNYQAQPNYGPQPNRQAQQNYGPQPMFMNRFFDHCGGSDSYFIVKLNGGREARFILKNGHDVHIEIPVGALWISSCGGWPSENGSWGRANPGD
jgi:hypothetical protein